jgi:hypothetical protein
LVCGEGGGAVSGGDDRKMTGAAGGLIFCGLAGCFITVASLLPARLFIGSIFKQHLFHIER